MEISNLHIESLKGYEHNTRTHSEDQIQQIAGSISEFGFTNPILIDGDQRIIAGHGRLYAAKALGMDTVPCISLDHLSDVQVRALVIADNQIAMNAGWDEGLLATELDRLQTDGVDIDLLGFDVDTLEELLKPELIEIEGLTDEDAIPEVEESICKAGDIWVLGNHRLLCGDATKKEDVDKLMDGQKIQMLLTDPPYGVDYSSKNEFLNNADKGNCIQKDIINDTKNAEETVEMWRGYFRNVKQNLQSGSNYYINFSGDKLILLLLLLREDDIQMPEKQILVWVKNNHVLGRSNYNYKHEFILYGWNGSKGHKHYGNFDTTVWEIDKPLKNDLHPTMKPIELLVRAIEHGTAKGMSVYDGFLGSGSTLIACEKTNRKCYGMEIDPHYCDVIVKRWEDYTGNKAERFEAANA